MTRSGRSEQKCLRSSSIRAHGRWISIAGLLALASPARAQTPVTVSVDAAAPGTPLERVWPFHGFDEVNYSTTTDGKALLKTLADLHTAPVYVRSHS